MTAGLGELLLWPEAWSLLLGAPLWWLVLRALDRARDRRLTRRLGQRALERINRDPRRRARRRAVAGVAMLAAIVAVLQPTWGEAGRPLEPRGSDLVICLDVSRSMLARDVVPSRLERARADVVRLAEHARGDRLGLVVFAGEARRKSPRTRDLATFAEVAARAEPIDVGRGGTDLGAALELALGDLEGTRGDHAAIVLVTDGEDHEQRGLRAAAACRARGIRVHCVAVGSALGGRIPIETGAGEDYLRDASGREVTTTLDLDGLRRIAAAGGGELVDGARPGALVRLYDDAIAPRARAAYAEDARRRRPNRYQWPLLAALLLWILETWTTDRRRT